MAKPRYIPKCFKWTDNGHVECSFEYLQGIYGFEYHEGDDGQGGVHVPITATKAYYPVELRERGGDRNLWVFANGSIKLIAPNDVRSAWGQLAYPMTSQANSYQPKKGEHGMIGVKIEDPIVPSVYLGELGIAWNAHEPGQLASPEKGNNYMHIDSTWGIVDLTGGSVPPVVPPSDPTPITGGVWLTADEVQRLRGSLLNVDDILRTATNRPPTRTV